MTLLDRIRRVQAEIDQRQADPLLSKVEPAVRGKDQISTAALLDLVGLPKTTGNARRVANAMRALGFIPIKSRRLMPGGFRDTVARGWARPVRQAGNSPAMETGAMVAAARHICAVKEMGRTK